ncbi:MAG: electron transfer flavoprotein subunit alpha/FixB family protein [Mogibacterium sp.]|nr:electron transfer flavoprotein subunit alpha/FixB family protein [Mogibacterium sp.]
MNRDIWVFAENFGGRPAPVYGELVRKANEMREKMQEARVCGVVLGKDVDGLAAAASVQGVDTVYVMDHPKLDTLDACVLKEAFAALIRAYNPEVVLVGATALGAELAPGIAGKLKTGLAAHCVDIEVTEKRINCMVPAFGGRVISEIYVPATRPVMASVRPGIFDAPEPAGAGAPVTAGNPSTQVVRADSSFLDSVTSPVEMIAFEQDAPSADLRLEDADIVVCAGRGVSTQEDFENVKALAGKLNAAFGCTRSFVDLGFVPDESRMIGTSGKSVKPQLFLGFGISGAAHHTCGMNKSKLVITVNRDEKARMFANSDYGVVGDAGKVVSALLKQL